MTRRHFQRTRPEYLGLDAVMPSELAMIMNREPPADGTRWQLVSSWTTSQLGAVVCLVGALLVRHRLVDDSPAAAHSRPDDPGRGEAEAPLPGSHAPAPEGPTGDRSSPPSLPGGAVRTSDGPQSGALAPHPRTPSVEPIEWVWLGPLRWHAVRRGAFVHRLPPRAREMSPPTALCPECNRYVRVRRNGRFYEHKRRPLGKQVCPGSGGVPDGGGAGTNCPPLRTTRIVRQAFHGSDERSDG